MNVLGRLWYLERFSCNCGTRTLQSMHLVNLVFEISVILIQSVEFLLDEYLEIANSSHHLFQLFSHLLYLYSQWLIIDSKIFEFSYCLIEFSKSACAHNIHLGTHALVWCCCILKHFQCSYIITVLLLSIKCWSVVDFACLYRTAFNIFASCCCVLSLQNLWTA